MKITCLTCGANLDRVQRCTRCEAARMKLRQKPPKSPMCEKLAKHKVEVDAVQDFFEWLQAQGIQLATRHQHTARCEGVCGYREDELQHITAKTQTLVMRWLKIDERKLEAERAAILDHHRETTGQR